MRCIRHRARALSQVETLIQMRCKRHCARALPQYRDPYLGYCPDRGQGSGPNGTYVSVKPCLGDAIVVVGLKNKNIFSR